MTGTTAPVIPADLTDLLRTNVVAHVTASRADGSLVTHVMWTDFDGEHVLTSSPKGSFKGRAFRRRPQVAVSVVDPADPWRRLSITGRVTEIRDDEGLAFINRLSERYTGGPYPRPGEREVFVITPDRVRAFQGRR
ncbi:MAG: TIGR03618 family F420-dependent PPOX class oxidoreductase [Candidatus Limnocylindrales bacterium]